MMFRSLLLHSVMVVVCAAGEHQTYKEVCVGTKCELQACFQSSCVSTEEINNQFPGMFISRMELNNSWFHLYNDHDQCCPTQHIFFPFPEKRNTRNRERAIVELKFSDMLWTQAIPFICCGQGDGCKKSRGTCLAQKRLMTLLVWTDDYRLTPLGPFEFDQFEVDAYCACKSTR